jgi:hypothetical protein
MLFIDLQILVAKEEMWLELEKPKCKSLLKKINIVRRIFHNLLDQKCDTLKPWAIGHIRVLA